MKEAAKQIGYGIAVWCFTLGLVLVLAFMEEKGLLPLPDSLITPLVFGLGAMLLVGPFILVKKVVKSYMLRHDRVATMDLSQYGYKQDADDTN